MVDINHSYAKVVEDSKWQSSNTYVPEIKRQEVSTTATIEYVRGNFCNLGSDRHRQLGRKLLGFNLQDDRQYFPFGFPNRNMAELTLQGGWTWKRSWVQLEWWNPIPGCKQAAKKSKTTWIRAIGLPLHLWSNEIFRQIGDLCDWFEESP
uniref:Uncharacterized protein n=1 Tax=Solanum lycopersicum TaxID=4081 RepID=A0A3Q7H2F6_SOLLC